MVQNASKGVPSVFRSDGIFDGLTDCDAEASRRIRVLLQDGSSRIGILARAGNAGRSPGVHHQTAVRFLIIADSDHVDLAFETEEAASEAEGASPLTCPGLRGDPLNSKDLVVIRLWNGSIGFMAA